MVKTGLDVVVRHVRRVAAGPHPDPRTDPDLLRQFAQGRDEVAFAALVRRHGPMVLRVCRHVLRHQQDAEDAFQVTFLVLARNPAAVRKGASLASWLHGVAYRTALTARRGVARRQRREARAQTMSQADGTQELAWREVQAILEAEVQALPEVYRAPFVLCQMEGRSRQEVARELGVKEGTLSSRLDRAHRRLRERLVRRGVALSVVLGAVAVAAADGTAAVPHGLVAATVRAGVALAAGGTAGGAVSASAEALLRAATRAAGLTRGRVATALLAAVLVVAGVATVPHRLLGQQRAEEAAPDEPPVAAAPPSGPAAAAEAAEDVIAVSGQVLDPDGKPFAGAEVAVRWFGIGPEPAEPAVKATSGPDGRFSFRAARPAFGSPPLPPHDDTYAFSFLQVVALAKGYGPDWANVQPGAKGEGLTLRLVKDDLPIKGRVLDVQLRPVAGATVQVHPTDEGSLSPWPGLPKSATTDKEGRFVLTGIGRGRGVRLSVAGPTIASQTVGASTEKASSATVEVIARPTRVFEGTVCAEDTGKPLAGVVVRGGDWFTGIYTLTDEQGHYRLVGLPKGASYEVTAWPNRGQAFIPKMAEVADSQGLKPITVDFRLQRGVELRVRLVDKGTGKRVEGIVHYDPLANNPARPGLIPNKPRGTLLWQYHTSYPERDGYHHFVALPGPGVVYARNEDFPYLTRAVDPADEKAYPFLKKTPFLDGGLGGYGTFFQNYRLFDAKAGDKPLVLDLELDPGCKVEGTLVGPDGKPVAGAVAFGLHHRPQARGSNDPYRYSAAHRADVEKRVLEADRFAAVGVPPDGSRTVTFLHVGRKLIANAVVRGSQKGPLAVRLEPWGAVTGRVVDADGKPLAGVTVELLYPSQDGPALLAPGGDGVGAGLLAPGWPFRTDAEGRFRVEGLIPGQKHRLTFAGAAGQDITPLAPEAVKDLSTKAGEVRDLADIRAKVTPAPKAEKGPADE
jgi:RNA polymerase sigma factor (sigma-70 family)